MLSAVVIEGRKAGQGRGLLATDAAELRHADDEGDCGTLADAGNAEHEIEAAGEVVMGAQRSDDPFQLDQAPCLQSRDIGDDHAPVPRIVDMFDPDLEAGDVLFDLFDEGQMLSQRHQALVRLDTPLIDHCRTGGDENGIEPVVLGSAQMQPRIGFDLEWLQHHDDEAFVAQIADHTAFIAAAGLDADTRYLGAGECDSQSPPTSRAVVDLPVLGPTVNRHVELGFRCIDSRRCANLRHLPRPRLVERTLCSGNHPGPMKALTRSRYTAAQNGSGWARSDRQPLCRGWPSAAEHSFRNMPTIIDLAMTRVGKGAQRRAHA